MGINQEVKGTLARLLATENLIVEHKSVSTASFDVINRVLVLPIWERASSTVYDLLVGHEVGHALYTPADSLEEHRGGSIPFDYINVIEDARIEKLMKRKYGGLARNFYRGYQELNDSDFFCVKDEDISMMSLIDRINLHFKIGAFALIPFNEEEKEFVEMTEQAETFADVILICEELVKYLKENNLQQEISISSSDIVQVSGSGDLDYVTIESLGDSEQKKDGGEPDSSSPTSMDANTSEQQSGGESDAEDEGDTEDSKDKNNGNSSGMKGAGPNEEVAKTQRSFDSKLKDLIDKNVRGQIDYVEIPELNVKQLIVDNKKLRNYMASSLVENSSYGETCDTKYREYKREAVKEVNYLVKEFECRKSADAYARATTSRTGLLDTKMLHSYKYNDDIFKKVSVIPEGKNHGLIFVLDWSGSMANCILDTVKQLLNLVWFCKKVQIPFEVYAFTYEWNDFIVDTHAPYRKLQEKKDGMLCINDCFSLLNFVSSKTNSKEFEADCLNLWRLSYSMERSGYTIPRGLDLSGTPLNESIVALHQIVPMFKEANKLQKVNTVILTDGEGNNLTYYANLKRKYGGNGPDRLGTNSVGLDNSLRDRKTGRVYRSFGDSLKDDLTTILLENLKARCPYMNLIGFRIISGSSFGRLLRGSLGLDQWGYSQTPETDKANKVWRKENCYEINGVGYDALYAIAHSKLNVQASFNPTEAHADPGKAFRDTMKKKRTNKKILSSFAELVS